MSVCLCGGDGSRITDDIDTNTPTHSHSHAKQTHNCVINKKINVQKTIINKKINAQKKPKVNVCAEVQGPVRLCSSRTGVQ